MAAAAAVLLPVSPTSIGDHFMMYFHCSSQESALRVLTNEWLDNLSIGLTTATSLIVFVPVPTYTITKTR